MLHMWNGTIFVDLDWPLNASSLLSASAELLVAYTVLHKPEKQDALFLPITSPNVDQFLPRDAMRKRGLCCRPVSVTLVDYIQTAEDIVKRLSRPGSPIILVFFCIRAPVPNSKGNPFSTGAKYTGWKNFAILDKNRRLSRKRHEIGPWLLWNVDRIIGGGSAIYVNSDDLKWSVTRVSRTLYSYKSNISKTVHLTDEATIDQ